MRHTELFEGILCALYIGFVTAMRRMKGTGLVLCVLVLSLSFGIICVQVLLHRVRKKGDYIMRRYTYPYNGKQFVLNTNTLEVHNLDKESSLCQINEIKNDHVYNCDSYEEAEIYTIMVLNRSCNGCAYCMPEKNTG